ncbi:unnamed protein product [Brassicogethes aeneus]|uniref:EF-hand domain-containing protein n=1 Tax=Brassicogethes aeneus TaxID=1431903 RepID=A0A9P0AY56_BRAAE|nr:unnamed protein product [Brassicogethes aeneus]
MGNSSSTITTDLLEEYNVLTYLTKSEILSLYKLFNQIEGGANGKVSVEKLEKKFPQLQVNPFRDRIYEVFSSEGDYKFSFEDLLDLCSVMSEKCPDSVKAAWAFRIFDFDGDNALGKDDLKQVIDRVTSRAGEIQTEQKEHIIEILLRNMDMEASGSVGQIEFQHAVGKMAEFASSFTFRF